MLESCIYISAPHVGLWTCTDRVLTYCLETVAPDTKAYYSRQSAHNLTYKYHCTVGASSGLKAEGKKREQMSYEQKRKSLIEEKVGDSWLISPMEIVYNELSST